MYNIFSKMSSSKKTHRPPELDDEERQNKNPFDPVLIEKWTEEVIVVRARRTNPLRSVGNLYCGRINVPFNRVAVFCDGFEVKDNDTIASVGLIPFESEHYLEVRQVKENMDKFQRQIRWVARQRRERMSKQSYEAEVANSTMHDTQRRKSAGD